MLAAVAGLILAGLPASAAMAQPGLSTSTGVTGASRTGSAPPALAQPASAPATLSPMNVGGSGQAADAAAMSAASREAESSGKPTTVGALTTGTSTTSADPNGEITVDTNVMPVRVRRGGAWTPVSTSLRKTSGDMLAPAAVPGDSVEFSDGGLGPLAVIAADGSSLSLSWPGTVPAPVVAGSSATYRGILPSVNLVLTATSAEAGGFSSVIEVLTAAAARNPELARLELAVKGKGVTLRETSGGGMVASGPHADGLYSAGTPVMWDSSSLSSTSGASERAAAARSAGAVGASLAPPGLAGARSTYAGPSRGARLAKVGTSVSAGGTSLSLLPDSALLTSKTTVYPVFIDPSFTWAISDTPEQDYDEVQSACPTASHYDTTDPAYWSLGVGYDGFGDDCNGSNGYAYAYYQVGVAPGIWGGYIHSAYLNTDEAYTASCSASADVTLSESDTAINSGTDWDNMPSAVNMVTDDVRPGPSNSCNDRVRRVSGDWTGRVQRLL